MEQATIECNDELKNFVIGFILDIMSISDEKLKGEKGEYISDNIRVLVVDLAEQNQEKPISKDSCYSNNNCIEIKEIEGCLDEIKNGDKKLEDLSVFESCIENKKCTKSEKIKETGKKVVMVQCLLLNEMVDYVGVIQCALDEALRLSDLKDEVVGRLKDIKHDGVDRTIIMEKYVQNFLKNNELPSAEFMIELSAQRYEGSQSEAKIYICEGETKNTKMSYAFDENGQEQRQLQSRNLRTIRKLMEMSKRKAFSLLADSNKGVVGLITDKESKNTSETVNIQKCICFNGYMDWSIWINGKEEFCYKQGRYFINSSDRKDISAMKVQAFESEFGGKVKAVNANTMEKITKLVEILQQQKHGTSVILTNDNKEAERLCKADRGILIDNRENQKDGEFDEEEILSVTDIDGALFMNLDGESLAFGIIVDGEAAESGNPGRGARFNCIHSYIEGKRSDGKNGENEHLYIALIFSEDGGVDILCNL